MRPGTSSKCPDQHNPKEVKEKDIIKGCIRGKAKAQKALVDRYGPSLLTVSRRYAIDLPMAEDILQDAFIKIFQNFRRFDARIGNLEPWLRRIVINTALDRVRKESKKMEYAGLDMISHPASAPDVYSQLEAEEIMALLETMPVGFRTVFNLYVIEGYSHQEIAEKLEIQAASSRSQLLRARSWMQRALKALQELQYEPKRI